MLVLDLVGQKFAVVHRQHGVVSQVVGGRGQKTGQDTFLPIQRLCQGFAVEIVQFPEVPHFIEAEDCFFGFTFGYNGQLNPH